jgi:hypothetical protein
VGLWYVSLNRNNTESTTVQKMREELTRCFPNRCDERDSRSTEKQYQIAKLADLEDLESNLGTEYSSTTVLLTESVVEASTGSRSTP